MRLHCLERIGTARGVEAAGRRQQRTDKAAVAADRLNQHPGTAGRPPARCLLIACSRHRHSALSCRRRSAAITRSSSAARSSWRAVAARGLARNTSRLPPGRDRRYARARCLSRRRTLLRTTAGPTRRLTMKPTRAGFVDRSHQQVPGNQRLTGAAAASRRQPRTPPGAASSPLREASAVTTPDKVRRVSQSQSDADARAALAPPGRQHRAAGPGAHAQPEAMRLGTTAIVRLERALTHRDSRLLRACLQGESWLPRTSSVTGITGMRPCVIRAGLPGQQTLRARAVAVKLTPAAGLLRVGGSSYRLAIGAARRPPYDPARFPTRRERQP